MGIQLGQWNINKLTLKRVLDFLPYPFLISEFIDNVHYNTFVNRKFIEEIGYTVEDVPTRSDWFRVAYPDHHYRETIITDWEALLENAAASNEESIVMRARIYTKNFGDKWYEVKSSFSNDIQLVAFINIHDEISRREELTRLNENKNHTLAILSHDLRGPITNLHSLASLALNSHLTQKEFVDTVKNVQEKTFQVLEFLDTTLHWTRSNFENITLKIEPVDVGRILKHILKIYESVYIGKRLNVTPHVNGSHQLSTDAEIITIVIRNLFSNAIKFTPDDGKIDIHVIQEHDVYCITVEDSGMGMATEMIERIFSDQVVTQRGTRQEKGLGIGLRLCKELLKKINGQLHIESKLGEGTKVSIKINTAAH